MSARSQDPGQDQTRAEDAAGIEGASPLEANAEPEWPDRPSGELDDGPAEDGANDDDIHDEDLDEALGRSIPPEDEDDEAAIERAIASDLSDEEERAVAAAMRAFDRDEPGDVRARTKPRRSSKSKRAHPKSPPKPARPSKTKSKTKKSASDAWRTNLTLTAKGAIANSIANACAVLAHDKRWQGVLAFDEFTDRIVKLRSPPWHAAYRPAKIYCKPGPWADHDTTMARIWLEREYEIHVKERDVNAAVLAASRLDLRHGPRDWLRSLRGTWDGVARIDTWLVDHAGAKDTPYIRAVSSMWLISAVARAFEPGCQVDHTLILEGPQGLGKSSLLRALLPKQQWFFCDVGSELGKVDSFQQLRGEWIVEMSELDSLTRSELSAAKAFMTNRVDHYRKSYGTHAEDQPRHCIFAGTTNKSQYLTDDTGNRRFWPVEVTKGDVRALKKARQQLFAEAVDRYFGGEQWHITAPEMLAAAHREQQKRVLGDPWEVTIAKFLTADRWRIHGVTTRILLSKALKIPENAVSRVQEMRCAGALRAIGWDNGSARQRMIGGVRVRLYFPKKQARTP